MIKANMHFYRSFGAAEFCPGKHGKAQVNSGGVEGIQLIPETKSMLWCDAVAAGKQLMKQRFVKRIGLTFVHAGKGASRHITCTEVVKPGCLSDDIAQAGSARKLCQAQRNELRPARHSAQVLTLVVLFGKGFKFMSRYQFQQLRKYRVMMCQGLNLPDFTVFASTSIVPTC